MPTIRSLFSFRGRVSRLTYWRVGLMTSLVLAGLWIATIFVAMGAGGLAAVPLLLMLPVLVINLAIYVRRLHDRNKSGWWLLLFWLAPLLLLAATQRMTAGADEPGGPAAITVLAGLALAIWALIEVGFLRGTPGDNRFGQPPPSGLRPRKRKTA